MLHNLLLALALASELGGYAKAAELNRYPGPAHVLELAVPLGLSRAQVESTRAIHARMERQAQALGAAAVLIRAVEPLAGLNAIRRHRLGREDRDLTSGPGKLAQALGIGLDLDRTDLVAGPIRIAEPPAGARAVQLVTGVRVGITKAAELPWRFADASSPFVSRPRVTARVAMSSVTSGTANSEPMVARTASRACSSTACFWP